MTGRPEPGPKRWPPLIVAGTKPPWIKVRDVVLTTVMWALFVLTLEAELELFFGHYLKRFGIGAWGSQGNWSAFFDDLQPYIHVALVLVSLLLLSGVLTLRRMVRGRTLPQPSPLTVAEEAKRVGLAEADLLAARALRSVVVHIDADGRHRLEPARRHAD